jgi:hypothetical protein
MSRIIEGSEDAPTKPRQGSSSVHPRETGKDSGSGEPLRRENPERTDPHPEFTSLRVGALHDRPDVIACFISHFGVGNSGLDHPRWLRTGDALIEGFCRIGRRTGNYPMVNKSGKLQEASLSVLDRRPGRIRNVKPASPNDRTEFARNLEVLAAKPAA